MIPSFPLPQNGHPPFNLIPHQSTPPIYGAVMHQMNAQVQFQQIVPQLAARQFPNFSFNQNYNNTMQMYSTNMAISIGQPNQNSFTLCNNPWPSTIQCLQRQSFTVPHPSIGVNSPSTLVSRPQMSISSPFTQMNQPHINLTFGRHPQQTVTRNHLHFCPYQPPACINQQRFSLNTGWSVNSRQLSIPTSTSLHCTNQAQQPLLRMPTVIIRPNTNGRATIIQLNNCNQSVRYYERRTPMNNGRCISNSKSGYSTQPSIKYNEEFLMTNKGECPICFDEMDRGDLIARLPCLCIFHIKCIDAWFSRSNTCPTHPPYD